MKCLKDRIPFWLLCICLLWLSVHASGQTSDIQRIALANQELRWGVGSFNAGQYSEAILSFLRSLSYVPDNYTARTWLGHAYYASGYIDEAVAEWRRVNATQRSALTTNLIETLSIRANQDFQDSDNEEYTYIENISGQANSRMNVPTAIHTNDDGTMFVVSMGNNRVLHLTGDGSILEAYGGNLNNLVTPFDVGRYEDYLFVTEITRDSISRLDMNTLENIRFGASGSGEGEFFGPQYITTDNEGNVYISDWGNKRINKFSVEGDFLLSFGDYEQEGFRILQEPTGIDYGSGIVYIADRKSTGIFLFDTDGNYFDQLDIGLSDVESIELVDETTMLVVRRDEVHLVDLNTRSIRETFGDETGVGFSSAGRDSNMHVFATDVERNEIVTYAPLAKTVESLFARIEQVRYSSFPTMQVLLRIEDALGNPVMGISKDNLFLFEEGNQIGNMALVSASYVHTNTDIEVLIQPNRYISLIETQLANSIQRWLIDDPDVDLRQISLAGKPATPIAIRANERFSEQLEQIPWSIDQALRISGNRLIGSGAIRRGIVMVSDGLLGPGEHFTSIGLQATARYLKNNGIRLHLVHLGEEEISKELLYIVEETGGMITNDPSIDVSIRSTAHEQKNTSTGLYILRYSSDYEPAEPVQFVSISAEIEYFVRTARAESGFFLTQ